MKKLFLPLILSILTLVTQLAFAEEENDRAFMMSDDSMEGFEIGGSFLYLQPGTSSDLMQYGISDTNVNLVGIESNMLIDPEYNAGFDVFARYNWETGQDLTLRYTWFQGDSNDSNTCLFNNGDNYQNCSSYPTGEFFHDYAEAQINTDFQSMDLIFGQRYMLGEQMKVRLSAGLTAAQIKMDFDQIYHDIRYVSFDSYYDFDYESTFKGIGPKVGIDGEYMWGDEMPLSLYMGVSAAGLIGHTDSQTLEYQHDPEFDNSQYFLLDGGSQQVIVPNINVDLGLRYQQAFNEEYLGTVSLGYRVNEYLDAVRHIKEYGFGYGFAQNDDTANFSLNGPYLELAVLL